MLVLSEQMNMPFGCTSGHGLFHPVLHPVLPFFIRAERKNRKTVKPALFAPRGNNNCPAKIRQAFARFIGVHRID
jgi:hypothetical protein